MTADLARWVLAAYRAAAGAAGTERARASAARAAARGAVASAPTRGRRRDRGPGVAEAGQAWSGAGEDDRDPQLLNRSLADLVGELGWSDAASLGQLQARWEAIVGRDVAEHSVPDRLSDGDLVVRARSTAWATQLTLLSDRLLDRIHREVGDQMVRTVRVEGPGAPRWNRGPLRVPGPGPRDTYG